jgi:hypothetical protein
METTVKKPAQQDRRHSPKGIAITTKRRSRGKQISVATPSKPDRPHYLKAKFSTIHELKVKEKQNEPSDLLVSTGLTIDKLCSRLMLCIKQLALCYNLDYDKPEPGLSFDDTLLYIGKTIDDLINRSGIPCLKWNIDSKNNRLCIVQYVEWDWDEWIFMIPLELVNNLESDKEFHDLVMNFMSLISQNQGLSDLNDSYFGYHISGYKDDVEQLEEEIEEMRKDPDYKEDKDHAEWIEDRRKLVEFYEIGLPSIYEGYLNTPVDPVRLLKCLNKKKSNRTPKQKELIEFMKVGYDLMQVDKISRYFNYQHSDTDSEEKFRFSDMINFVWCWNDAITDSMETDINEMGGNSGVSGPTLVSIVTTSECEKMEQPSDYPTKFLSWLNQFINCLNNNANEFKNSRITGKV